MTRNLWPRFALAAVVAVALPYALGGLGVLNDYRSNLVGTGACLAIAAFGLNVVLGYTGQVSLAHYALVGFGAFVGAKFTSPTEMRLPFIVGLIGAGVVTALAGLFIGLPALRIRGLPLAIATIAFQFAASDSLFRTQPLSAGSGGVAFPRPWIGGYEFKANSAYLALILLAGVAVWLVDTNLTSSRFGRAFQAIRANEDVAASFGIDVARHKLGAFALSGFYAGVAGCLLGHLSRFVNADTFKLDRSLVLIIIVVVGGLGSRPGIAAAAAFFGISPLLLEEALGSRAASLQVIVGALLLLLTMALNPGGLAGGVRHSRERRALRAGPVAEAVGGVPALANLPLPAPTGTEVRDVVLEARDVVVTFGGVQAVGGASLVVPRGQIVGLIGPNGAGKTTLFNAIAGMVPITRGRIVLEGQDITGLPAHQRVRLGIGRTFQQVGLARERSVMENLLLAQHTAAAYGPASGLLGLGAAPAIEKQLRERGAEALAALGFEAYAERPVASLSGGQQRIVEIACRLVAPSDVLLLDEPSAGMAPGAVEALAERLRSLRDSLGRTLVIVEHNMAVVLDVCDSVTVLDAGEVIAQGEPSEVAGDPAVIEAYLGAPVR